MILVYNYVHTYNISSVMGSYSVLTARVLIQLIEVRASELNFTHPGHCCLLCRVPKMAVYVYVWCQSQLIQAMKQPRQIAQCALMLRVCYAASLFTTSDLSHRHMAITKAMAPKKIVHGKV